MRRLGAVTIGLLLLASGTPASGPVSAAAPTWQVTGPSGGTVRAVAIRPGASASLLAGTGGAGIFRSENGGASWVPSRSGLPPDTIVNAIAFAPSAPDTVYAATYGSGGHRSDDGGRTWQQVWSESTVLDIAVDPTDPDRVALTAGIGVYLSTNGGDTWTELLHGLDRISADRTLFAPSEGGVLFVAGVAGVLRSEDDGDSWLTDPNGPTHVTAIAVDPEDEDRVFAATHFDGVFRSLDGGATWTSAGSGLPVVPLAPEVHLPVLSVAVHPSRPATLYAGTARGGYLYRSTNSGASWSALPLAVSPHTVRAMAMDPTDGRPLYVGLNHEGLLRSTDGGATWARADARLVGSAIPSLLVRPGSAMTVMAGTVGQGLFRSTDGGVSWRRTGMAGLTVDGISSVPAAPRQVYAASSGGLYRSTDGGESWSRVAALRAKHLVDVAVAPTSPRTVYVINLHGMWRSTDAGASWRRISSRELLISVAVHPGQSRTVFLGLRGGVARSDDGGATWRPDSTGLPGSGDPRQMVVDPQRPWIVYAAVEAFGFFKSRDGGATFRQIGQELGLEYAQAVVLDPRNPARVYAGGFDATFGGGVRVSPDRGATWQPIAGTGLSTTWVASLAVAADTSRIYAGTTAYSLESGGGVFSRTLP